MNSEKKKLTYRKVGIDRKSRERSRSKLQSDLFSDSSHYKFGKVLQLPFGSLYPSPQSPGSYLDLQIEGVGTKTLLAELSGSYSSIGIDAVAMAVNDVLRSGSRPLFVTDAIHIAKSQPEKVRQLVAGVRAGAKEAGAILVSGETGDVAEILHSEIRKNSPPFDLFVSCLGFVMEQEVIRGRISPGDKIIGLKSSGIHSNGLSLARKVLFKAWGGKFDPVAQPESLERPILDELLIPTRIYGADFATLRSKCIIKAAVHITGDGFSKFHRLLVWDKGDSSHLGFDFRLHEETPPIFQLIQETARSMHQPISNSEMYKTFNMGFGFAVIVAEENAENALDSLNKKSIAEDIGSVTETGKISLAGPDMEKPLLL